MSGINVDPLVGKLYGEMKVSRTHKYAAFKIVDNRRVVIDYDMLAGPFRTDTVEEDAKQFNRMKSLLRNGKPRYIVYNFAFRNKEGRLKNVLAFIFW